MSSARNLDELRREVDRLDDAMVDLLIERVAVVQAIAAVKRSEANGQPAIRPAREAAILRRLVRRAAERLPAGTLVRMWRELLAATTRAQSPFTVGVAVPPDFPGMWDIARDHFGSLTPLRRAESPSQVLRLLAVGTVQLVVLPMPGEQDRWWTGLLDGNGTPLRVVARLPFSVAGPQPDEAAALVVAPIEPEPSGDDLGLAAIETIGEVSRGTLVDLLAAAGLAPRWLATCNDRERGITVHLVEVAGFLPPYPAALDAAFAGVREHVLRVLVLGSYARPLTEAD